MSELLPMGDYHGTVVESCLGQSSKETPYLAIVFDIEGARRTWRGWLTDGGLLTTIKALEALRWSPGEHAFDIEQLHGTQELVGRQASLVIEHEEYNGVTRDKIRWVNDPMAGRATDDEAKAIAARAKEMLKAAATAADEDEVPF